MRNQYFRTKITELFKIKHPILCGGLMWLGNAEYAAAAVNAGGMGFLTAKTFPDPIEFKDELLKAWDLTAGQPFGVNLYQSMRPEENKVLNGHLKIALDTGIRHFETAGLPPTDFLPHLKEADAIVLHKVSTVRHAISAARKLDIDAVTIVGAECGGHPGLELVSSLVQAVVGPEQIEIPVVIGDRTVQVSEFISTPKSCSGDCKSDWSAVDANGNDVAWISHKKIENSKKGKEGHSHGADFHGWGGMSDGVMKDVYNDIPEIKQEILDFAKDVLKAYPTDGEKSKLPKGVWLFRKIKTGILRGISVYGPAFRGKDSARGLQNVDLILQGTPSFNGNTLVADIHHSNGDRAEDGYEPYLTARYNPSRNSDIQGISFKGMRFSIYAKAGIVQRKGYSDEIQTVKKI